MRVRIFESCNLRLQGFIPKSRQPRLESIYTLEYYAHAHERIVKQIQR